MARRQCSARAQTALTLRRPAPSRRSGRDTFYASSVEVRPRSRISQRADPSSAAAEPVQDSERLWLVISHQYQPDGLQPPQPEVAVMTADASRKECGCRRSLPPFPASSLITEASVTARGARRSSPSGADRKGIGDDPTGICGMWLLPGDRRARDLGLRHDCPARCSPSTDGATGSICRPIVRRRACKDMPNHSRSVWGRPAPPFHQLSSLRDLWLACVLVAGGPTRHATIATWSTLC